MRISTGRLLEKDEAEYGRQAGDALAYYILHIPPDDAIHSATIDYAKLLSASRQELRSWFEGRAVVIGDARVGRDGPYATPDRRRYSGYVSHAIAIDSILSQDSILAPPYTRIMGKHFNCGSLLDGAAVVAGSLVGLLLYHAAWRRRLLSMILALLIVGVSVLIYRQGRIVYNPIVAMLGVMIATEAVGWLRALSWKNPTYA